MNLLQMTMQACMMIFAITVIRALTINLLPKKTFLALWGVVLVRLLVPVSIPSPFSVYSLTSQSHIAGKIAETVGVPFLPVTPIANGSIAASVPPQALISPWLVVWAIGAGICALYFAIIYFKCHQQFLVSDKLDSHFVKAWISEHKTKRAIEIRQSDSVSAPLAYGVFHPVILMPYKTDWADTKQIQYILQHEYVHIRHFDTVIKLVLTVALCVHWFNPLVWVMYVLANRDMELSCDEAVVRSFGETIKSSYALALINMEEKKSGLIPFYNSFSKNSIEERIGAIMKYKKASVITFVVAVVLVAGVITGFATSAVASDEAPAATPITISNAPDDSDNTPVTKVENAASNASESTIATLPDYEEYEIFGLTYNNESGRFYLDNELVRYFEDKTLNRYFGAYEDGKDNVYAVRSADGLLTSLEVLNWEDAVFDIKYREYADFGLKFQKTDSNGLELHGKPISSFSDVAAGTGITRKNGGDGVEYEAIRDTSDPGPVGVGRLIDVRPIRKN